MLKDDQVESLLSLGNKNLNNGSSDANRNNNESINKQTDPVRKSSISNKDKGKKKDKKTSQFTAILKVFNIIIGLILIGFSVYCYYGANTILIENKVLCYVMPGYIGLSGLIILLIECRIKAMCRNMRFLYNFFGRGLFNIYIGVMPLTLIPNDPQTEEARLFRVLIIVVVIIQCLVGVLYIVAKVFCCQKEDMIDQKDKKKGSDSDSD